jgi:hypothetical protein
LWESLARQVSRVLVVTMALLVSWGHRVQLERMGCQALMV